MKKKIVIFGDINNVICRILFWQILKLSKKKNFRIIKFFNTEKKKENLLKNIFKQIFIKFFNFNDTGYFFNNTGIFIKLFSGIKIESINDINDEIFISNLKKKKYDYALSLCCNQIFRKQIISCFTKIINYHSSFLPYYKGLNSTLWSIFFNEKFTGFSFHYVDSNIDSGKIILQKKFKIDKNLKYKQIEMKKTLLAKNYLNDVLDLVFKNTRGFNSLDKGSYYGNKKIKRILTFKKLNNLKLIKKIINIWGGIIYIKQSKKYYVTKISDKGDILRINYYPIFIYKIFKFLFK